MAEDDAKDAKQDDAEQPIIIKKINIAGGHHGGAWKVAYADFVTAMMAFFLLMWLLNVTTDEQKNAISNYFDPTHPKVSESSSGAGGVMGGLSMSKQGSMATNVQNITTPRPSGTSVNSKSSEKTPDGKDKKTKAIEKAKEILKKQEEKRFEDAKKKIEQAIQESPELKEMEKNLMVDVTPEGLRIQIIDQEGKPMFASGSARMFEKTETLMAKVGEIIQDLPNELSIRGHTDSVPYGPGSDYTNWELSTDRANTTRRVLLDSGFPKARINNVVGKADTEPLLADKPDDPSNRRMSIILLNDELTNPDYEMEAEAIAEEQGFISDIDDEESESSNTAPAQLPVGTFRRTPGNVEFP